MAQVASTSENLHEEIFPTVLILGQMKYSVSEIYSSATEYVYVDDGNRDQELEFIREEVKKLPVLLENYQSTSSRQSDDELAFKFKNRVGEFIFTTQAFVEIISTGNDNRILLYHKLLEEEKNWLTQMIDTEIGLEQHELQNSLAQVKSTQSTGLQIIGIASLFFLGLSSVIAYMIYRSIAIPIGKLKDAVTKIGSGLFEIEIPGVHDRKGNGKGDEVQDLAIHIDHMKNELREKDKMKQEFINIAAHELRTPIQPILSFTELARKGLITHAAANEGIHLQAKRLKQLSDDILDVARIDGKNMSLRIEGFDLGSLIEQIVREKEIAAGQSITFNLSIEAVKEIRIYADRSRIIQVLTNVIGNAVKFTKEGTVSISGSIDDLNTIQLIISDTGPGIPDVILPRLFEKFSSKSVKSGNEHGSGLGLYICKGIIEAHGGSIAAYNNENGGATFKILLPISSAKESQDNEQDLSSYEPMKGTTKVGNA